MENKSVFDIWKARLSSSSVPGCLFIKGFIITFNQGYFSRLFNYIKPYYLGFKLVFKSKNCAIFVTNSDEFANNYLKLKDLIEKDRRKVYRYIGNLYPFSRICREIYVNYDENFRYRVVSNVENIFEKLRNLRLSKSNFDRILTIFYVQDLFFIGDFDKKFLFNKPKQNFVPICRSYYKIEEAFEVFGIRDVKKVLDLGSAPGGWVQFLLRFADKIVAVDPADLKLIDPKIIHIKKKVEDAFEEIQYYAPYDLITCDINNDPREVFKTIEKLLQFLNKNGSVLMTVKLIYKNRSKNRELIKEVMELFNKYFSNVRVEWLFANTKYERMLFASNLR